MYIEQIYDEIGKIHNRQVAKILAKLEEANLPRIYLDAVKQAMWFQSKDYRALIESILKGDYDDDQSGYTRK